MYMNISSACCSTPCFFRTSILADRESDAAYSSGRWSSIARYFLSMTVVVVLLMGVCCSVAAAAAVAAALSSCK